MTATTNTLNYKQHNYYLTLILLCLGYFIDFYDLTIMGVGYNELLKEQFHITNQLQLQQTYLLISNCQTLGIFIGAFLFGTLGDKIGRASAIRYSILLYSITTILAVYTPWLEVFIFLRVLSYIGLATEFATSTVLIIELFSHKSARWGTAILYCFGVLGGICATSIGMLSWKIMFLSGGIAGLVLYFARKNITESPALLAVNKQYKSELGSLILLISNRHYLAILIRYFILILPYFALISLMFLFPNYIIKDYSLGQATRILLLGFFIGNIISSLLSAYYWSKLGNPFGFMLISLIIFISLMSNFAHISETYLWLYSCGLGCIGGGYPIVCTQLLAHEYPVYIRSLASNALTALGRLSGIIFNLLITNWLMNKQAFIHQVIYTSIIVFLLALGSLILSRKNIQNQVVV